MRFKLSHFGWGLFVFLLTLNLLLVFRWVPMFAEIVGPAMDTEPFFAAIGQSIEASMQKGFRHTKYHFDTHMAEFYMHSLIGVIALVALPFQFWGKFRMRFPAVHRWTGRIAAVAVLFTAYAAIRLALNMPIALWGQMGFVVGAFVWIYVLTMGVVTARKRDFRAHRSHMVIMAAVAFGAVTIRLQFPFLRLVWEFDTAYAIAAWTSWVLNVAAVYAWRYGANRRRLRARAAAASAAAATTRA